MTLDDLATVCVIVPAYNEAEVLESVLTGLLDVFPRVVCVDDGSSDGSADIARTAGATVVRHAVNLGQGAALETGFAYARSQPEIEHVITFDADGQHDIGDALTMLATCRATGTDIVLGSRALGATVDQPLRRALLLRAALLVSRVTSGLPVSDTHNGLRVLSRRAFSRITLTQPGMAHASELEGAIKSHGLTWLESPTTIRYTEYSLGKGQAKLNAINIVFDLAIARLRSAA